MYQRLAAVLLVACAAGGCDGDGSFGGVNLRGDSVTVAAGDTADFCVELTTGGQAVTATQNDLRWDPSCLTLVDRCAIEPTTEKQLLTNQREPGDLRAIVISLQDVNSIPDGQLYCCPLRAQISDRCCPVEVVGASGSDPDGVAVSMDASSGQVCVE